MKKNSILVKASFALAILSVITVGFGCGKPRSMAEADINGNWRMKGAYITLLLNRIRIPTRSVIVRLQVAGDQALLSAVSPERANAERVNAVRAKIENGAFKFNDSHITTLKILGVENGLLYAMGKFQDREVEFEFEKDTSNVQFVELAGAFVQLPKGGAGMMAPIGGFPEPGPAGSEPPSSSFPGGGSSYPGHTYPGEEK